jgi:hypothetical protein
MSRAGERLEFVAVPSGAWCDPAAGTCSIDDDGASSVEASGENVAGDIPDAPQ